MGSPFSYATARDWARFGLLFLQDGVRFGKRILPEGWVKYTVTPSPGAPKGEYGAYCWLNAGNPVSSGNRLYFSVPSDLYLARGYEEQNVIAVPSRKLLLVHLRACIPTLVPGAWHPEEFIGDVLKAIKEQP